MKRLLQRIADGLYYQGTGVWTKDPDLAAVFHKTSGAIECCMRENLPAMQLVLKFEDSAFDIRLPCWTGSSRVNLSLPVPEEERPEVEE